MKRRRTCSKRRYPSRYAANLMLLVLWKRHRSDARRHERRAYLCPLCMWWHLTSQPEVSDGPA